MKKVDSKLSRVVQQSFSLVVLSLLVLLVSCGGGSSSDPTPDPTPTNFELTVATTGTGTGTVTSNSGSIDCGSTCKDSFTDGTSVTLTATPSDDSNFTSWSGCDSTPTATTCVVAMSVAKTVTATFGLKTPTVTTPSINAWQQISVGSQESCGIGSDNQIYCWGQGTQGQLGIGNNENTTNPTTPVINPAGVSTWKSLSTGAGNSCGIGSNNQAYCWGLGGFGTGGQLGTGNNESTNKPTKVVNPAGVSTWESVSAGGSSSCGIGNDNQAYCWGLGTDGQLGTGKNEDTNKPTKVVNPVGVSTWKSVSASGVTSCGIGSDNQAYCWGFSRQGQLGTGNKEPANKPTKVLNPAGVSTWKSVSAGTPHSCGIGSDNQAYCWGVGILGQLGTGTTPSTINNPTTPVINPAGVSTWKSVIAAGSYSCGIANDSQTYCWGFGTGGQLGTGNDESTNKPTKVVNPAGVSTWKSLSTYLAHSCGIGNDNQAYCWGQGEQGQLGVGNKLSINKPTKLINP